MSATTIIYATTQLLEWTVAISELTQQAIEMGVGMAARLQKRGLFADYLP